MPTLTTYLRTNFFGMSGRESTILVEMLGSGLKRFQKVVLQLVPLDSDEVAEGGRSVPGHVTGGRSLKPRASTTSLKTVLMIADQLICRLQNWWPQ
jgi:hypothetical protein